ncbi:MAG: hypothetical protein NTU79_02245 [Planctomycetota bacterium]|nr:hypothetical protein [Planctomycetota bacterium]
MKICVDKTDSANRLVRILGWLTIAIAVAPQVVILGLMHIIALSPDYGSAGPIGGKGFALGICGYLAVVAAPWTLGLCLTAWGLFRHRPWARTLTLGFTVFVFVLTFLFGGWLWLSPDPGPEPSYRHAALSLFLSFLPFLLCSPYCFLAQLWLWRQPVRALFRNPRSMDYA